jgi:DNA-binding NtrC family response regulator
MFVPGLSMEEIERVAILRTFEASGRSTRKTAELLGISRRKIQYKLKEWGVDLNKP